MASVTHEDDVKETDVVDMRERKRRCTDVIFFFGLIAAWFCMTIVGFIVCGVIKDKSLPSGDPAKLSSPVDYLGHTCGYHSSVENKPYGYYMANTAVVCVKDCPSENDYTKFFCHYDLQSDVDGSYYKGYTYVETFSCMYKIKTKVFFNRCVPDTNVQNALNEAKKYASATNETLSDSSSYATSNDSMSWFNTFIADVCYLRGYIFGFGIGIATAVSFLYLYLLRIPGLLFTAIWSVIISIMVLLFVGSWLLWSLANTWSTDGVHGKNEIITMRVFAYFGIIMTVLYVCVIVVLRSRIQLAIGVVKQASRAMTAMPSVILLPIIQTFGVTCFLAVWVVYVFYLASSGEIVTETTTKAGISYSYRTYAYTKNSKYAFLYLLFCWFWTSEFIIAAGQLIIALSFASWYFTRDKSTVGNTNVIWAFRTTARYHLGTAAFGSLIIAIIKTIRAVLAYIERKAKKSGNKIAQYIICIISCCLWCLEKCMKFLNKHAYILTAIYAYSFCKACRRAFFLLLRNILRVAAVNMVASFLLMIGKLFAPVFTTFLCYLAVAYGAPQVGTTGIIAPLILCFVLAYWISGMFSEMFGMGIETILFSFIADEEMYKVEDRFAEAELMSTLQKTAQAHKASKAGTKVHQVHITASKVNFFAVDIMKVFVFVW
mmetsp:Transcript_32195/g.43968  ORF Transcript_32195/g.43968 Transcript_32195/m.43968 type:complete len:658 (+) Transcript_32195:87-2060(+)